MKKRIFRNLAMVLVLVFLSASFAGCGSDTKKQEENTAAKDTTAAAAEETAAKLEPITFTMFSNDPQQKDFAWESPIHKKITELTGVTLKIEVLNGMDQNQKRSVMVASGEFPDFLTNVGNVYTDGGVLRPLDELIDKYGTNIKKTWGDSLNKLRYEKDGKIYFIGQRQNEPAGIADANQCLLIQYDVLDKLGYPKLKTLDDVYKALKDYTAQYKDLNGKPFIPWGLWADTWGYNITLNNPALWTNGFTDNSDAYVDENTYQVKYFNSTDYFKDYLKWLNKLYNDKMIDKTAFITKNDQMKSLASTGRILAMIDGTWDITDVEAALRKAGMPERCYARFPIVAKEGTQDKSQVYCESYAWGIGISTTCKNPERAMQFLDFVASDEGTVLLNWGVEGVHYDKMDGKRVWKPEVIKQYNEDPDYRWKEGLNCYILNNPRYAVKLSDGDYAIPTNFEDTYKNADEMTKKVMDKYGMKYWGQNFDTTGKATPYGFAWSLNIPQGSPGAVANTKADTLRHISVPNIVMAKDDAEFNQKWDEFQKKLVDECKINEYEKAMTDLIDQRLKLWKIK